MSDQSVEIKSTAEVTGNGNGAVSAILPHLESWEKLMEIPSVFSVVHQGENAYRKVKCKLYVNKIYRI